MPATQALELAVKGMPDRIRQQMDATRHYLIQNNIDPHFADVLLSHYGDFARELDEALTALPQEEVSGWRPALQVLADDLDKRPEPIAQEVAHHLRTLLRSTPTVPQEAPRDFVLVPREPTEEMKDAAVEAAHKWLFDDPWRPEMASGRSGQAANANIYRAMIAAAPTQPPPSNPYQELVEAAKAYRDALAANQMEFAALADSAHPNRDPTRLNDTAAQANVAFQALLNAALRLQTKDGE